MALTHRHAIARTLLFAALPTVLSALGCKPNCDELERSAERLLDRHRACETDRDCTAVEVEASCLSTFACPVAVSRSRDLEDFRARAAELSQDYRDACDECSVASCAVGVNAAVFCDANSSRCAFVPTP